MTGSESRRQDQAIQAVNEARVAISDADASAETVTKALIDVRNTLAETSEADEFIEEIAELREALPEGGDGGLSKSDRERALGGLRQLDRNLRAELLNHSVTECLFCGTSLGSTVGTGSICRDCVRNHLDTGKGISLDGADFSGVESVDVTNISDTDTAIVDSDGAEIRTDEDGVTTE